MSNIVELSSLFHRSKDRILELGEVFTPEKFVDGMLDLLTRGKRNFWNNEDLIFFEPSCGHGNIVVPIYKRRLEAIFKKAESTGIKNPAFYAVANALNTLWAIDIDSKNTQSCQTRLLVLTLEFLKEKTRTKTDYFLIEKNREFFAHIFCALTWQIHENEALSALSNEKTANSKARQTRIGNKWFSENGHQELDFELSWVDYYKSCLHDNLIPLDFERSQKFIDGLLNGTTRGYSEFDFAKFIINDSKPSSTTRTRSSDVVLGV